MHARIAVIAFCLVAALGFSDAGVASMTRDRCARRDARVLLGTPTISVLEMAGGAVRGRYVACRRSTGRSVLLGRKYPGDDFQVLSRFRITGSRIAFQTERSGLGRSPDTLRRIDVRDLRSGRLLRRLPAGEVRGAAFIEYEAGDGVRDLELSEHADLAWVVQNPFGLTPPQPNVNTSSRITEVYVAPRIGQMTLLDQGDDIGDTSLRRSGCTIRWTRAGMLRSARICP